MVDLVEQHSCAVIDGAQYTYRIDAQGSACIEHCKATCSCLRIPDTIGGCPVTAIGDSAFAKLSCIEDVVCPCMLRHIGRHAFEGCLRLRSIELNEGLLSVGEGAFFLCTALGCLNVPASVESFGPRPLGSASSMPFRKRSSFDVRFAPDGDHLFFDEFGVLYERRDDGLVLVDGYRFEGDVLRCDERTVEIGARALSGMANLCSVVTPEGLKRIGDGAFRGSTNLARVNLPSTLESIGEAAFSCTALEELALPARCEHIDDSAFALGPISADGSVRPFRSTLRSVSVEAGNKTFCMHGGTLCKQRANGELEAMLAPCDCTYIEICPDINLIHDTAFAGTTSIETLRICDGVKFESAHGLVSSCAIGSVEIAIDGDMARILTLDMPLQDGGRLAVASGMAHDTFNSHEFVRAYDKSISKLDDPFEQACIIVKRLASPALLEKQNEERFTAFVSANFNAFCLSVGQRNMFAYFELMADAGILDEDGIAQAADRLSASGDAQAMGYLLDMKQRRFGKATWDDYEL
ncbi:MAG: leucine-rich repeat domain-containing protein [Eggerthellaceae bacterium]|nr:leucine-rich repeat domain-containing protein [Eggerthellaceae bacterium]